MLLIWNFESHIARNDLYIEADHVNARFRRKVIKFLKFLI